MKSTYTKILTVTILLTATSMVLAGGNHAENNATNEQTTSVVRPYRLSDGSVIIPKQTQRQLNIRTTRSVYGDYPKTVELAGKIIPDPNYGGKVQSMIAGRITPPPNGFPTPGESVHKGQLLAYITPDVGPKGMRSLAESRLKRLQALSDTVTRKTLEEAQAAVANEELRASVDGIISTTGIVSGQVVDARQTIFEITNADRFMVEAIAYDTFLLDNIQSANITEGDRQIPLKLLGTARNLREQALPITFVASEGGALPLAIGQAVRIFVQTKQTQQGYQVPASALVKDSANQSIIWVKESPIKYLARTVTILPLDGTSVVVNGLENGDIVVSQSASLVNQIR